jgi:hypothetical protein
MYRDSNVFYCAAAAMDIGVVPIRLDTFPFENALPRVRKSKKDRPNLDGELPLSSPNKEQTGRYLSTSEETFSP